MGFFERMPGNFMGDRFGGHHGSYQGGHYGGSKHGGYGVIKPIRRALAQVDGNPGTDGGGDTLRADFFDRA